MKSRLIIHPLALILAAGCGVGPLAASTAAPAPAEEKSAPKITRSITITHADAAPKEVEKLTYLGVETGPVPRALAAHLGLDRDFGLVVNAIVEGSPAAGVLQENDVLKKLGDQLLVDSRQLAVLIRTGKPGDEVKLTLIRAGREKVVTAKLGEREAPRGAVWRMLGGPDAGPGAARLFELGERGAPALERLREIPGLAREEIKDVLRIVGREGGPRVHVWSREGDGSTILNLREGNFTFSDDAGSIEVNASGGERQLRVKDAAGKVLFDGPVNTEEQRAALPGEIKARLKKLDTVTIEFPQPNEGVRPGAAAPAGEPAPRRVALPPPAPGAGPI